ncbi:LPXTG cell wall anchor domain-containing protein [Lacticaseibacillus yichunensis]|uniref:LPXTG cell wall anchor domain-containing protein n=1 Tax=Lacticaseibacillus yichunensis TaxID=2486015 RepID=UPI0013DDC973|nr:LPXTG cell wall anchor domain-containing protein [Lacticaseibacillus yichunensis]
MNQYESQLASSDDGSAQSAVDILNGGDGQPSTDATTSAKQKLQDFTDGLKQAIADSNAKQAQSNQDFQANLDKLQNALDQIAKTEENNKAQQKLQDFADGLKQAIDDSNAKQAQSNQDFQANLEKLQNALDQISKTEESNEAQQKLQDFADGLKQAIADSNAKQAQSDQDFQNNLDKLRQALSQIKQPTTQDQIHDIATNGGTTGETSSVPNGGDSTTPTKPADTDPADLTDGQIANLDENTLEKDYIEAKQNGDDTTADRLAQEIEKRGNSLPDVPNSDTGSDNNTDTNNDTSKAQLPLTDDQAAQLKQAIDDAVAAAKNREEQNQVAQTGFSDNKSTEASNNAARDAYVNGENGKSAAEAEAQKNAPSAGAIDYVAGEEHKSDAEAEAQKNAPSTDTIDAYAKKAQTDDTTTPATTDPDAKGTKLAATETPAPKAVAQTPADTPKAAATSAASLPQAGDANNASLAGLGVVAVVGALFGLAGDHRKRA